MEIIQFWLNAVFIFGLTYAVGFLLFLPFFKQSSNKISTFFLKLLLGFIFIPTFFALFYTNAYTILAIVPILYVVTFIIYRKSLSILFYFEFKWFSFFTLTLLFFIILQIIRDDYFNKDINYLYQVDAGIYTTVATYLPISGIEVSSPWYQLIAISNDHLAKPYHFGDLWFLTFFLQMSTFPALDTLLFCYIPVITIIIMAGNLALWSEIVSVSSKKTLLLGIVMSIGATFFYTGFPNVEWSLADVGNIFMDLRIASLYVLLLGALLMIYWRRAYISALLAGLIPVFNILYSPIIFSAFGLFYLTEYYYKKPQGSEPILKILILIVISIYIVIFYLLFGSWQTAATILITEGNPYWYSVLKSVAAITVKFMIFNSPLLILSAALWKHRKKTDLRDANLIYLTVLIFITSTMATALLNFNVESFQFFALTYRSISGILFLLLVACLFKLYALRPWAMAIGLVLTLYAIFATIFLEPQRERAVTTHFLMVLEKQLKGVNPIGASLTNRATENTYTVDPRVCLYCNFLKSIKNDRYWVYNLSLPENADSTLYPERKNAIQLAPFYRFIQHLKKEEKYKSYEDAQIKFINKYQIDFIVVEKGTIIPQHINDCIGSEILDSLGGHRVLLLQRPCNEVSH